LLNFVMTASCHANRRFDLCREVFQVRVCSGVPRSKRRFHFGGVGESLDGDVGGASSSEATSSSGVSSS
jgi:hypothetical protein